MDSDPKSPRRGRRSNRGPLDLRGWTLGLEFALTILVVVALGYWADVKLETSPWILVVSLFVGFGGALYSLVLKVDRLGRPRDGDGVPKERRR